MGFRVTSAKLALRLAWCSHQREKNPCSQFTSHSFLVLIQNRKKWDQIICYVSLNPVGILERKRKNQRRKKWKGKRTQKGPKNFWDYLLPFCWCPPSAFVLSPQVCSPVVCVSSLLPATILLIVGLARILDSPAVLHVLLWGLLWWK